jgi:hypothetical protein
MTRRVLFLPLCLLFAALLAAIPVQLEAREVRGVPGCGADCRLSCCAVEGFLCSCGCDPVTGQAICECS